MSEFIISIKLCMSKIVEWLKTNKIKIETVMGILILYLGFIYTSNAFITFVIGVIAMLIFYFINTRIETSDKKEKEAKEIETDLNRKIVEKWKKYEYKQREIWDNDVNYYLVGIDNSFKNTEIDYLIYTKYFTKENYDHYKNFTL